MACFPPPPFVNTASHSEETEKHKCKKLQLRTLVFISGNCTNASLEEQACFAWWLVESQLEKKKKHNVGL